VISLGKDSIVHVLLAAYTEFTRLLTAKNPVRGGGASEDEPPRGFLLPARTIAAADTRAAVAG
jgi:hypothetical protein